MRRTLGVVLVAAAASVSMPVDAHATVRQTYRALYQQVKQRHGTRAPGRDIGRWGVLTRHGARRARARDLRASIAVLRRMMAPAPRPAPTAAAPTTSAPTSAPVTSPGASGLPSCASESGTNYSTGPSNTNASSGATGRYQIIPSTHASLCSDLGWSPGEQDRCAGRIYDVQGSGAWVGCG